MRYWRIAPDPRLRPWVQCYWVMDGDKPPEPTKELLIPDGLSEIVFNRSGTGFDRWKLGEAGHVTHMKGSYVIGGRSHSVDTLSSCAMKLAGVKLDSRYLRALIRVPLNEFRDRTLSIAEVAPRRLRELDDAIANAASVESIATLLDRYLLAESRELPAPGTSTDALVHRIHRDHGNTPILRWAREERIDTRGLERRFCAATGMTPKQYARVIRFKRAYRRLLEVARTTPLSAQLDGYYDQSHFNREFRHFTGMAPQSKVFGRTPAPMIVSDHLLRADT